MCIQSLFLPPTSFNISIELQLVIHLSQSPTLQILHFSLSTSIFNSTPPKFSTQSTTSRTPSVSICNSVNLNLCHRRPKLASLSDQHRHRSSISTSIYNHFWLCPPLSPSLSTSLSDSTVLLSPTPSTSNCQFSPSTCPLLSLTLYLQLQLH